MDSLQTYIKMCEKAEEIQSILNKHEDGNLLVVSKSQPWGTSTQILTTGHPELYWLEKFGNGELAQQWVSNYWESDSYISYWGERVIWLPRQDQLQAIWGWKLPELLPWFYDYALSDAPTVSSMEQLWLAFVMKDKYGKRWNGEDWIT